MRNISKTINSLNHLISTMILSGLFFNSIATAGPAANDASSYDCTAHPNETDTASFEGGYSSRLCLEHGNGLILKYTPPNRELALATRDGRFLLQRIPVGAGPELVGAEDYIRFLPMKLQPYLSQEAVLFTSAIRSSTGEGGGQCGSGAETYLNVLSIKHKQKPKVLSRILIGSCLKSIELAGAGMSKSNLEAFTVSEGKIRIAFLNYGDEEESRTATLSTNLRRLELK